MWCHNWQKMLTKPCVLFLQFREQESSTASLGFRIEAIRVRDTMYLSTRITLWHSILTLCHTMPSSRNIAYTHLILVKPVICVEFYFVIKRSGGGKGVKTKNFICVYTYISLYICMYICVCVRTHIFP